MDFVLLPGNSSLGVIAKDVQAVIANVENDQSHLVTVKIEKIGKICVHVGEDNNKAVWRLNTKDSFPALFNAIRYAEFGDIKKISGLSIIVNICKHRYDLILRNKVLVPLFLLLVLSSAGLLVKRIWAVMAEPLALSQDDSERQKKINVISFVVLAGFCLAIVYHYILGIYWQMGYPYNTFLCNPQVKFTDFFNLYKANIGLNPYFNGDFVSGYYPFCNILFTVFSIFSAKISFIIYIIFFALAMVYVNALVFKGQNKPQYFKDIFILSLLTYPFLFLVDRGNIDGLVFILSFLFFIFYEKKRYLLSAIMLGLAVAMKVCPIFYAIILLSNKKYKEFFVVVLTAIAATLGSLFFFEGNFLSNLIFVGNNFGYNDWVGFADNTFVQRGVSLFFLIKAFFIQTGQLGVSVMAKDLSIFYDNLIKILSLLVGGYILWVEKELWKKATMLTLAILLFPPISADYKLIFIFIPIYFFIKAQSEGRGWIIYSSALALLLIPKDYLFFKQFFNDSGHSDISIGLFINMGLIFFLFWKISGGEKFFNYPRSLLSRYRGGYFIFIGCLFLAGYALVGEIFLVVLPVLLLCSLLPAEKKITNDKGGQAHFFSDDLSSVRKAGVWPALLATNAIMGVYNLILFNKFFPVTEGWWSTAAHYILAGKMPYRDFYLPLTPLYPMAITGFVSLFGYSFLYLRILGILFMLGAASLMFFMFLRFLPAYIAAFVTLVAMFLFQSFSLITYDFNVLVFIFTFTATLLFFGYIDHRAKNITASKIYLVLCAFFVSLLFLTKQNNGVLAFLAFIFLILIINRKKFLYPFLLFCFVFFVPVATMMVWLAQNGALAQFWQQIFRDGTNNKGSLIEIIFAWVPNLLTEENIYLLVINFFILFAFRYKNLFFLKITDMDAAASGGGDRSKKNFLVFLLFCLCCGLTLFGSLSGNPFFGKINANYFVGYMYRSLPVTLAAFTFLWFIVVLLRCLRGERSRQNEALLAFLVISITTLLFATTSAHNISLLTVQLSLGLLLGVLVFKEPVFQLSKVFFFCAGLCLIVVTTQPKLTSLYGWWGVEVPGLNESTHLVHAPYLQGFYLDEKNKQLFEEVNRIIQANTNGSDTIFTFPHMPVFYLMSGRYPVTFSLFHWFDAASDRVCFMDAERLKKAPPKIIVWWADEHDDAMLTHEKLFRGGNPCGQREIIKVLHQFVDDGKEYTLEKEFVTGEGASIKVWRKMQEIK
jgi:Glycosyltransferase family 87